MNALGGDEQEPACIRGAGGELTQPTGHQLDLGQSPELLLPKYPPRARKANPTSLSRGQTRSGPGDGMEARADDCVQEGAGALPFPTQIPPPECGPRRCAGNSAERMQSAQWR